MTSKQTLGATPEEVATLPGLLVDLALSLVPRRIALASGLLALLGGYAREKVRTLIEDAGRAAQAAQQLNAHRAPADAFQIGRELLAATARLENAVMTLVIARARAGAQIVPDLERLEK